ncbi:MAG TPA: hypothetical protein VI643_07705 [Planctomycetota bacterium]|nr:hypothetical protein [Planctomycetota bacterium]
MVVAENKLEAGGPAPAFSGFVARVEPIWQQLKLKKTKLGFFEYWGERRRIKRRIAQIRKQLKDMGVTGGNWDRADGECMCNLRVGKMGLLQDLRERVSKDLSASAREKLPHFLRHREWNAYYLPVEFPQPFSIHGDGRDLVPVGSSPELRDELGALDEIFRFGEMVSPEKLAPQLKVSESDIIKFDTTNDENPEFWICFGFSLLKKLCDESIKHALPIVFP